MSLLEGIGLGSCFSLLLWAVSSIMPLVVALETEHLTDVSLEFRIWTRQSIVMVMASMSISPVSNVAYLHLEKWQGTCV